MAKMVALVCLVAFNQFGSEYQPGDVIPAADTEHWGAETLANRLSGGFVKYDATDADAAAPAEAPPSLESMLQKMSKAELIAYGKTALDLDVKGGTKAELIAELLAAAADQPAE